MNEDEMEELFANINMIEDQKWYKYALEKLNSELVIDIGGKQNEKI